MMFYRHRAIRRGLGTATLAVLLFPLAPPATAAKTKSKPSPKDGTRVEGRVLGDDAKSGIAGAIVHVRAMDGTTTWSSQPSDARGRFAISGLPYGWAEIVISAPDGEFLGDQAINLPPGSKVSLTFTLLPTADKPESWWKDRRVERPPEIESASVSGMALSSQKLTGVEYWKSPKGIAILASAGAVALGLIAAGGNKYRQP